MVVPSRAANSLACTLALTLLPLAYPAILKSRQPDSLYHPIDKFGHGGAKATVSGDARMAAAPAPAVPKGDTATQAPQAFATAPDDLSWDKNRLQSTKKFSRDYVKDENPSREAQQDRLQSGKTYARDFVKDDSPVPAAKQEHPEVQSAASELRIWVAFVLVLSTTLAFPSFDLR
mmetsp:Transcript_33684/g.53565  ORF Transcript_33684/g.53565 Transcript_33684/m.53565 type:complete len:175 (+) Transcript_33684:78-602(+)